MSNTTEVASAVATKTASVATYGGAGSAVFFGLSANEFGALCGVIIGFVGLVANIWFKHQHLKLAREQHGNSQENN
jgi:hypothetical protein